MQVDRLLQLSENLPGAGGDGVELLLGEVEAGIVQRQPGQHVEGQEGHGDQQQAGAGIHQFSHLQSAFFRSTTMAVAASQAAIRVMK
ncbi:hypothetical protein D3C85_1673280 [compost metagenome]